MSVESDWLDPPHCLPCPGHLGSQRGVGGTLRGLVNRCAPVTSLPGLYVTGTGKSSALWDH